uniref:Methylmalonic aciduria and homocystinuria type D protein, mitochondrial n=1 Tax=Arion vulgaris TaxID=1028688 RepID=A0A0B7ALV2_9EUPU
MAAKMVNCSKVVFKRLVAKNCRTFSSASDIHIHDPTDEPTKTQTVWPDHVLGPLGPQDKRFPMPGRVGPCVNTRKLSHMINLNQVTPPAFDPDNVLPKLPSQRHIDITEQFLTSLDEIDIDFIDRGAFYPGASDIVEYRAYKCPQLLRKEFKELFLDKNIMDGDLTVVTICLNTQNDMAMWSSDVEQEREELHEIFIQTAVCICQAFEDSGYWADFIDPSSGKPFKGPHTNHTLYETDDRYGKLGFQIDDLECCKLISHPVWGSHVYFGSLFTSAPRSHPLIMNLI